MTLRTSTDLVKPSHPESAVHIDLHNRQLCQKVCTWVSHTYYFLFFLPAVNGSVREEIITNKTSPQISELLTKLTNQSGLDIIRIRKPFHTDSPSIQGQWHPFTNRPPSIGPIRPQKQDNKWGLAEDVSRTRMLNFLQVCSLLLICF